MWTYHIRSGTLLHDGEFVGSGYSGSGQSSEFRNRADKVQVHGHGPIPPGNYFIGAARSHPKLGPVVMNLDAMPGTNTYGRSLFRIHGDNARHDASHGCIILGPLLRRLIADSDDKHLQVTAA